MTKAHKRLAALGAVLATVGIALALFGRGTHDQHGRYGFTSPEGGFTPPTKNGGGAGGGLAAVTTSGGILSGSGTAGSPLTMTLTTSSPLSGTGSSGSPLTGSMSVTSPMAGTGSSGSPLTWSPTLGTVITGTGSAGAPLRVANEYANTHMEWNDEWLMSGCAGSGQCGSIWTFNGAGTGAAFSGTGTTTRPGVAAMTCGSTSTRSATLGTSVTAVDFASGSWTMEWTGGFPVLADNTNTYAAYIGFGDVTTSINQVDGCGFLYDNQNVATNGANAGKVQNWECYCSSGSTRTVYLIAGSGNSDESFALGTAAVAALTLPSTNIQTLKVAMTGTTRAEFYVNGTKVCDINTHIPSGAVTGALVSMIGTAGASETMDIDRTRVAVDLTGARTP